MCAIFMLVESEFRLLLEGNYGKKPVEILDGIHEHSYYHKETNK